MHKNYSKQTNIKGYKMATRGLNFLAKPNEFLEIVNHIISLLNLQAISVNGIEGDLVRILPLPLQIDITNTLTREFFLTDKEVKRGISVSEINLPREGWIQVVAPKERDSILWEGYFAIKNDWYEENNKCENKDSLIFFNKVKRMFKKHLKYPVFAYNVLRGNSWPYKIIGYTEGAKQFEKDGGLLVNSGDDGFNSIRFAIDKNYIKTDPDLLIKRLQ